MRKFNSEANLHEMVTQYLRLQYPNVLFRTDMGGVRLSMRQAVNAKKTQAGRAWPDLFIAEPNVEWQKKRTDGALTGKYGLFLELKTEGTKLYLKDGVTMVANPHYREQAAVLQQLRERGYAAHFAVGFEQAKEIIDKYLS